jgi:hypothetical protein
MNANLSIAQILADLETQIGHLESQEAFHARNEETHRGQRELYAAELARVRERYDAFKTAATAAGEVVNREMVSTAQQAEADARLRIRTLSKLILHVVEGKSEQETFGATTLSQEVNARFGNRLRRPLDPRTASVTLRRMEADGRIQLVEKGRAFHEAMYARQPKA